MRMMKALILAAAAALALPGAAGAQVTLKAVITRTSG